VRAEDLLVRSNDNRSLRVTPMSDLWTSLAVFALLCASAGIARFIRPRLPETHRANETVQTMQVMISMLVTFAALVLGLLTASAKNTFDRAALDGQDYALQLTQLDQCLRNLGPDGNAPREILKSYTAAAIASTWPSEPPPAGVDYPDTSAMPRVGPSAVLGGMMNRIDLELRHVSPGDNFHLSVRQDCLVDFRNVSRARLIAIESASGKISLPFRSILVLWLMIIFATFGLAAPRNSLSLIGIVLCAVSLSSAMFVISDLDGLYDGLFAISSAHMRAALAQMVAPAG
jgi:hypothetical protein